MSGQWIPFPDRFYLWFRRELHDHCLLNTDHRVLVLAMYVPPGPKPLTHVMGWWTQYYGSSNHPIEKRIFGVIPAEHIDWDKGP